MSFKYKLNDEIILKLINMLLECIHLSEESDLSLVTKWINTINSLLKYVKERN